MGSSGGLVLLCEFHGVLSAGTFHSTGTPLDSQSQSFQTLVTANSYASFDDFVRSVCRSIRTAYKFDSR